MDLKTQHFYSNGKLIISGEYLVLKGAKALAMPLKFGQDLKVEHKKNEAPPLLYWKSYENDKLWFELILSIPDLKLIETSDRLIADKLIHILKIAFRHNPSLLNVNDSLLVSSHLNFDKDWGLGSSSTLINNIANWAGLSPYYLLEKSFGGSGFDIACASTDKPILYQLTEKKPSITNAGFDPIFKENINFIYLGKKQSTKKSVVEFEMQNSVMDTYISEISNISLKMAQEQDLRVFQKLMASHEEIMSKVLKQKKIKEKQFPDFNGEIKSLGAWGGDFIMAVSEMEPDAVRSYFRGKNLNVIFNFNEIIR